MDTLDLSDFQSVLEKFEQGLRSKRDRESFRATTLDDLRDSIAKIQIQQHADRKLQNLKRLEPFLEAANQYGEVVHLFCTSSEIMPFIWGPMRTLLEITSSSSTCNKAFDELVGLYEKVGEAFPLLQKYEDFFRTRPHKVKILVLIYKEITEFHQTALECFQKLVWERLFDINWKTIKRALLSIVSNLVRHKDAIQNQANQSQMTESEQTHGEPVSEFDLFGEENHRPQRLAVCQWLRPVDPTADQNRFSKIRADYPSIGRWLLHNATFKGWFDLQYTKVPPLLWLTGLPGAGKTILTSLIVEEVQKLTPRPQLLFFYCKQRLQGHNTFLAIARSFLLQLLNQDKSLLLYLYRMHCDSNEVVLSSIPLAQEMLKFLLSGCKNTYIIIDGLDECDRNEQKLITQWFRHLVESVPENEPSRLRCLFVSQDDRIVVNDFQGHAKIEIEPRDNKQDVLAYCRVQAEELRYRFGLSEEEASRIAVTVADSVKGIFLLAKLIWINLNSKSTLAEVEDQVSEFPREINQVYERLMDRIVHQVSHQTRESALKLLGWLVCAKRPLKWHEIQSLKSINLEQQVIDFTRLKFAVSGKHICGSLVKLQGDGALELIHVSAKAFLTDNARYIDKGSKELELACICIGYLNLPIFRCQPTRERVLNGDYGFMDYAVLNWTRHLEAGTLHLDGDENKIGELSESLETFIRTHWREPTTRISPSDGTKKTLEYFKTLEFYDQLEQSVSSWKKQLRLLPLEEVKSQEVTLDLGDYVLSVRKVLEDTTTSADPLTQRKIEEKYGNMVFKCPRLSCQYFSVGFSTQEARDKHLYKHTRPFLCPNEGCTGSILGFTSWQQRDKHIKVFHPEEVSHNREFRTDEDVTRIMPNGIVTEEAALAPEEAIPPGPEPEPPSESDTDSNLDPERDAQHQPRSTRRGTTTEFKCPHCPKVYTRKFNLASHLKSHTDERPFACNQCTKTFARLSDLVSHEDAHQEEQHVCTGVLRNGATWGCGRAFSRADILKTHHESKAGQKCILPFKQEKGYMPNHATVLHDNHSVDDTIDNTIGDTIGNTIEEANDDTNTEFSTNLPKADTYIETFARHLASHTCGLLADETTQTRISKALPPLLKAFALQVGHQTHLPLNKKAMAFVYQHRRKIAEAFENIQFDRDISQPSRSDDGIDRRAFLDAWIDSVESPPGYQEDELSLQASPEPTIAEQTPEEDEASVEIPLSAEVSTIVQTTAFEWLLSRLLKEFHLAPTEPYAMQSIGQGILATLPRARFISRNDPIPMYSVYIELECKLFQFFERQKYLRHPHEVFDSVIALTGSSYDVQAATCGQYLTQTWPSTAPYILEVLKDCLMLRPGRPQTVLYPDGTALNMRVDIYALVAEVNGMASTVAEIGEQLAWLGAAFRERTDENGLIYCAPKIDIIPRKSPSSQFPSQSSHDAVFRIQFHVETLEGNQNTNGQCWQSLFKSPILVKGYPIPRRNEWNSGLEASLDIMAGLAQADQVHAFGDMFYIKGYSTMLVPTRHCSDIQYWHLIHRTDGSRLSHFPDDMTEERSVGSLKDLEHSRHILGWCSEAESFLGLFKSSRTSVARSMLPNCAHGAALAGETYQRGRPIAKTFNHVLVTEDTAPSLGSGDYEYRLRLLEAQFFLLWDEEEKRGWLINGANALLHAVEQCVAPDMNGDSRSAFLFRGRGFERVYKSYCPLAVQILNNRKYQRLPLYDGENSRTTVGDKIKELCSIFEYLVDLQNHSKTKDRLRGKSRKYLEGWDFRDVVSNFRAFYSRQTTLDELGKEWVDFIRAIKAVTLFGRGFGEIIRPQKTCGPWATLPTDKYYIATLISDLQKVLEEHGLCVDGHLRLGDDLIWHSATPGSEFCKCKGLSQHMGEDHRCEPVQICFPLNLAESLNSRKSKMPDSDEGALIFGHHSQFPWFWDDIGNPKKRQDSEALPSPGSVERNNILSPDSGIGSSMSRPQVETRDRQRSRSEDSFAEPSKKKQKTETASLPVNTTSLTNQHDNYVGIICALPHELAAVRATFDVALEAYKQVKGDDNCYFTGEIARHKVVVTCLPKAGTNHAASTAKDMSRSYSPSLCLLVGIGGGVPSEKHDIRLGDVVVGSSVVQYDYGSETEESFQIRDSFLQSSPSVVENVVRSLCSDQALIRRSIGRYLGEITSREGLADYCHPGHDRDILVQCCSACRSVRQPCDHLIEREQRKDLGVKIHYGKIASGNKVIKSAVFRDEIAAKHDVRCFEMEAAGIANTMPYLVVRGISDYCDGNKNDEWQDYAAATAAAYAKLLLSNYHK